VIKVGVSKSKLSPSRVKLCSRDLLTHVRRPFYSLLGLLESLILMSPDRRSLEQVFRDFWDQLTRKCVASNSKPCGSLNSCLSYRPQQLSLPWDDDWKLDGDFFKDLAVWDNQHRDSTFLRVVGKIKDATITCKPFMELIPNEPFPARGLVLALSHFLHLGVVRS